MCKKCLLIRLLKNLSLHFHSQVHVQISILTMVMKQKVYLCLASSLKVMFIVQSLNYAVESYRTCNSVLL